MIEFEREVISRLARIEEHLNAQSAIQQSAGERIGKLEKTVNGNGKVGLVGKVSFLELKITAICAVLLAVFQIAKEIVFSHGGILK